MEDKKKSAESEIGIGLEKSNSFVESILSSLPGLFYAFNEKGRFLKWNKEFERVTGYSAQEISKMSPLDLFIGEDKKIIAEKVKETFEKGASNVEANIISKDGTATFCYFTGLRTKVGDENILVGMGINISERKLAEEALAKSKEKYRELIENLRDVIYTLDVQGIVTYISPSVTAISGYSPSEIIGKSFFEFIYPEDLQDITANFRKNISGEIVPADSRFLTKDGQLRWAHFSNKAVYNEGRPVGLQGVLFDITERKFAEEELARNENKFRVLFESSRDAIMTLEPPSWRFTSCNQATVRMFMVKDEAEFISYAPWELSPKQQPDGRASEEKAKEMIETAMRKGFHLFEWTHKRVKGEEFLTEVFLTKVETGGKVFLQARFEDINDYRMMERENREHLQELEVFYKASIGREERIMELKQEVEMLKKELGK